MGRLILLATRRGFMAMERNGGDDWRERTHGLAGQEVTSIIAREGVILAGTREGVWRSDDLGETWCQASTGLTHSHVRWLAFRPEVSDFELAGTEPAGIFISRDGGANWRECAEVSDLRRAHRWFLPYSPEAGCVRSFAVNGARAFAAVEVGGVLRSDDGGESWRLADGSSGEPDLEGPPPPFVYPDVHSLVVHPSSPDLVFAPTGGGFYVSSDGGTTWELVYDCYVRAVWVDPADPGHMVLGPAENVDALGRIERTRDGGKTWEGAASGLRTPWRTHMVERFEQAGDELLAVLSNGELLTAPLTTLQWRSLLPASAGVNAVTTLEYGTISPPPSS